MSDVTPAALAERIEKQKALRAVLGADFKGKVYLVGGAIREMALGKAPRDYDFALETEDDLKTFADIYKSHPFMLGKKPIQIYRIAKNRTIIDLTLLNGPIEKDLERRDFTMNAIAYDVSKGVLIDTLGGLKDILDRVIRYPARESLTADPLRMLKAVRHFATLKGFFFHDDLLEAIGELRQHINRSASERIKYEMDLIMTSPGLFAGMKLLETSGLLFEIFPELEGLRVMDREKGFELETFGHTMEGFRFLRKYARRYHLDEKTVRTVGYALLFHDLGKASTFSYDEKKGLVHFFYHERVSVEKAGRIMERLKFSTHEARAVLSLIEHHMRVFLITASESSEKATRRLVYKLGELTPALVLLTLCDMYGSSGGRENPSTRRVTERCEEVLAAFQEWKKEPLPKLVNGNDLLALGYVEGTILGACLTEIRERQIAGEIVTRDQALDYAGSRVLPPR
jgi:tRNA nucleotidyltransferase/poly(A) polymerase